MSMIQSTLQKPHSLQLKNQSMILFIGSSFKHQKETLERKVLPVMLVEMGKMGKMALMDNAANMENLVQQDCKVHVGSPAALDLPEQMAETAILGKMDSEDTQAQQASVV